MRPRPAIVTLTTDFGTRDPYVGIVKGVILGLAADVRMVDLTHEIPPQDVVAAGLALGDAYPYFPAGTIHVAVVDPGVGSKRRILAAEAAGQVFLAPDNGLLSVALRRAKIRRLVSVVNRRWFLANVSRTFHGRDVFAPVAARLAAGTATLAGLGPRVRRMMRLPLPKPTREAGGAIHGLVIGVDRFGNLVTNVDAAVIRPRGQAASGRGGEALPAATIEIGGRTIPRISPTYGDGSRGEVVAVIDSCDLLEIAARRASAAEALGLGIGAPVVVRPGGPSRARP